ncbi:GDP-L-fucose synthase [Streptomyces sp. SID13031]|uniref:GDP-L-fucose synthase family protein n=1 Tax=Streptomyces sp. SID13031 TaxID=2706046 RepID=UPI0013CB8107|nr:GDP-L-fucose synthase [Streptomyces sp. SID13031]NEA33666.1 GDP-L-fucose synthase [Streptomyces sp. SID13031]
MGDRVTGADQGGRLDRNARVYVAGHRGLVGSAIWRKLESEGFTDLIGATSSEVDLRDRDQTFAYFAEHRPQVVIDAAAKVGGILANRDHPTEFLSDNLRIQVNLMDAALEVRVPRLLFLGSSCIYPKFAEQPIKESSLLTGELEPTNDAYAIAKIAGIMQVQAVRRQHGLRWISAMPTNLYGPNDNFDLTSSHVMPALIRRFHDAQQGNAEEVVLWGTGTPKREFLHVDDLADASLHLLEHYDEPGPINVGVGTDVTIRELAGIIAKVVGYEGAIGTDPSKPDGTPRKLLDVSKLGALGWKPGIDLEEGVASVYAWYLANGREDR